MSSLTNQLSSISCASKSCFLSVILLLHHLNALLFCFVSAGRKPPSSSTDIRLVLLGKTGSGKSSTANTILGRKVYDTRVSCSSVTLHCRRACGEVHGRHLTLLETPGLLNTHQPLEEVLKEMRKSVDLLSPGPTAFLLIIHIGRFTQEEKEAVRQIKQAMGYNVLSFSVVVFTHGDLLEDTASVKHCLIDDCKDLAELVAACGGRYCVFNNQGSNSKEQVTELLALVDSMMQDNDGSYYNIKMLQKAEENLVQEVQEERRRLKEKEELLRKVQQAAIREWYEKELEMVRQQNMMEMQECTWELEKVYKLASAREETFRRELEENQRLEMHRRIQEMVKMMELRKEEEEKRQVLQRKLDRVMKKLQEQTEQVEKMRQEMQKDSAENEKARERELERIEKEQAIRQMEDMKVELDEVDQSWQEPCEKAEESPKQMEDTLRYEMEENQNVRVTRAETKITEALTQELKLIKKKTEEHKVAEVELKRHLDEYLQKEREKRHRDMCLVKTQQDKSCSKVCSVLIRKTTEKHSTLTTIAGHAQEMGLVGLNTAIEAVGAPCCIQ